jgi:hypothetical protein
VYVDDLLWYSPKQEHITEAIQCLHNNEIELEPESDVAGFLGIHIEHNLKDGMIKLTQKGLT